MPYEWHEEARLQPTTERSKNESPLHSNGQRAGVQYGYSIAMSGPAMVDVENRISELSGTSIFQNFQNFKIFSLFTY